MSGVWGPVQAEVEQSQKDGSTQTTSDVLAIVREEVVVAKETGSGGCVDDFHAKQERVTVRVKMTGPSGEFTTNFSINVKIPPPSLEFRGREYTYAGTQDGAHFYKENK